MKGRFDTVINVLVIVVAFGFVVRPDGPVSNWIQIRQAAEADREWSGASWSQLSAGIQSFGEQSTDIELVEFTDYQCPFCRSSHSSLLAAIDGGVLDTRIGVRHNPLAIHANAELAARASICMEPQEEAWAAAHSVLYVLSDTIDRVASRDLATLLGHPLPDTFEDCLRSEATDRRLQEDISLAAAGGLRGTPAYVTDGQVIRGTRSPEQLAHLLRNRGGR